MIICWIHHCGGLCFGIGWPIGGGFIPIGGGCWPIGGEVIPIGGGCWPIGGGVIPIGGGCWPIGGGVIPIGGGIIPIEGGLIPICGGCWPIGGAIPIGCGAIPGPGLNPGAIEPIGPLFEGCMPGLGPPTGICPDFPGNLVPGIPPTLALNWL